MSLTRQFQGWTTAALPAAVEILTRDWTDQGPLDLRGCLIVVPTRHAGRRLRAELARTAAARGTAVLAGSIVTPEHLVPTPPETADDALVLALLAKRLLTQRDKLSALIPATNVAWDFPFALGIAAQLQDVRRQLAEADRAAADLLPLVPEEERARWAAIDQLENGLLQDVARLGRKDPLAARREAARRPTDAAGLARVIALFVPDFSALAIRRLQALAATCPVELHVLAPESEAARFDDWGRPLPDRWENEPLPLAERHIHVFEQAPDETEALAALLGEAEREHRALAVCTPDPGNAQALARRLQIDGRSLYLPNGVPLAATAPGRLLAAWLGLLRRRDYASTAAFLRHPDAQDWLGVRLGFDDARALLSQLDQCQTEHLPTTFDDLRQFAKQDQEFAVLSEALEELRAHFTEPFSVFLANLFDGRRAADVLPADPLFAEATQSLANRIRTTEESARLLGLPPEDAIDLLLSALAAETVFPKPDPSATRETIGWMEVQWETAPAVLLADLREGVVPETRIGDAFLPDALRVRAGLAGNRDLLARDLFLARTLLESRPPGGVRFLYSRRAANQEPQLPSRLLLACPADELPGRVGLIFGRPALHGETSSAPAAPALPLAPPACRPDQIPGTLSVTAFKAYLACPFRFYLAHVLRMRPEDDGAREIDPLNFGNLAHEALRILKKHETLDDEEEIQARLLGELDRLAKAQYGPHPSFAAIVQLDSLRQRLSAAAKAHAASVRNGWRIIAVEEKFEAELGGLILKARIDRIDRHLESGAIRILDYKTSESGEAPLKTHFRPRSDERWVDLQLPLYRYVYEQLHPQAAGVAVGYFNLPKAVAKTGIVEMELRTKDGEDLYDSAIAKAREVAAAIRAGTFWPPTDKAIRFDDFEPLFAGGEALIRKPGTA
ncbi:MAG: PD-(D/E)XK nuclease family protein [Kiritimatiellia bacterium]